MKSNYGKLTRNYIINESNPKYIIDLGAGIFDNASVDTNILITQKNNYTNTTQVAVLNSTLDDLVFKNCSLNLNELWNINNIDFGSIKDKVQQIKTRLIDFNVELNYGILTGANKTFILSKNTADELKKLDPANQEIIKPILRGKDLDRYTATFNDVYLLCTHNGIKSENIPPVDVCNEYPSLIPYFESFGYDFKNRGEQGDTYFNLRNCTYIMKYLGPKILYADIVQNIGKFYLDEDGYFTNDTASIEQQIGETQKSFDDAVKDVTGVLLSDEIKAALESGEYTEEEMALIISGVPISEIHKRRQLNAEKDAQKQDETNKEPEIVTDEKSEVPEPPKVETEITEDVAEPQEPEETEEIPVEQMFADDIAVATAKMYVIKNRFMKKLENIEVDIVKEYASYPANERKPSLRKSIAAKYLVSVAELETQCDAEVEAVLQELKTKLSAVTKDFSVIEKIRKAYADEKSLKKAYYMDIYLNGLRGKPVPKASK
jgi:hypothetical protein